MLLKAISGPISKLEKPKSSVLQLESVMKVLIEQNESWRSKQMGMHLYQLWIWFFGEEFVHMEKYDILFIEAIFYIVIYLMRHEKRMACKGPQHSTHSMWSCRALFFAWKNSMENCKPPKTILSLDLRSFVTLHVKDTRRMSIMLSTISQDDWVTQSLLDFKGDVKASFYINRVYEPSCLPVSTIRMLAAYMSETSTEGKSLCL